MPAFATHFIFYNELLPELEKRADFTVDEGAAGIGAQGPDLFLFHRLWPMYTIYKSLNSVSGALHRCKTEKLFEAFRDCLESTDNIDITKSYIYAFILHYALDRTCHPYVYARQDELTAADSTMNPLTAHNIIEHGVDTYLLNTRLGIYPPSDFDSKSTFSDSEAVYNEVARILTYTIKKACGREVPEAEVIRAITDTANTQDKLRDVDGGTTRLAHFIEGVLKPVAKNFKFSASIKPKDLELAKNCANIDRKPWTSPYDGSTHSDSIDELFERSKADAIALLDGFDALCRGEKTAYEVTGNISFLTGIEVTDV